MNRNNNRYYARYEANGGSGSPIEIHGMKQATEYNNKGYAIVFTGQTYRGDKRRIDEITRINYCFCDIDNHDGSYPKNKMSAAIQNSPLTCSLVVETKNGYHCYWELKEDEEMDLETFKEIETGICEYFGADKQAIDPTRLLRVPGFYHTKDPNDKFLCQKIIETDKVFNIRQLKRAFANNKKIEKKQRFNNYYPMLYQDKLLDPNNWEQLFKLSGIKEGERNGTLTKIAYRIHEQTGLGGNALFYILRDINQRIQKPLDDRELKCMIRKW